MHRLLPVLLAAVGSFSLTGCCHGGGCGGFRHGLGNTECPVLKPFALLRDHGCFLQRDCPCPPCSCCPYPYGPPPWTQGYPGHGPMSPVPEGHLPEAVPSVPAGVYDDAAPGKSVPPAPTEAKTGSIILQKYPSGDSRRTPVHEAKNRRWLPAGL